MQVITVNKTVKITKKIPWKIFKKVENCIDRKEIS